MKEDSLKVFYELKSKTDELKTYGYNFNSCLSEKKIASFEKKFKIKLPEDYRNYLKIIGNGGDGPSDGIFKLKNTDPVTCYYDRYDKRTAFRKVKRKFPYTDDKEKNELIEKTLYGKTIKKHNYFQGSLVLVNQGCGHYYFMEVSGNKPGRIWEYVYKPYPFSESFYKWFSNWVEQELKECEIKWGIISENFDLINKHLNKESVNKPFDRYNTYPIHIAVYNICIKSTKYLLELGANPNSSSWFYVSSVEELIEKIYQNYNNDDDISEELELIKILADKGAELNTKNIRGESLLDTAKKTEFPELVELLSNLGVK